MPPELQTSLRKTEIVKAKILKQINDYRLCAGQRIPPEAELTQRLEVSRSTVRDFESCRHGLHRSTEMLLIQTIEEAGVRLLASTREGPGVRLRRAQSNGLRSSG